MVCLGAWGWFTNGWQPETGNSVSGCLGWFDFAHANKRQPEKRSWLFRLPI
ncbi:hypothetical protein [Kingella sp. (in: b-proteobacteria)]|uniref:hypothetical protein n=1 Tax=Kingella sp. (in: b-proteobacteria) TaxID=2020713 RepID=UPI0026DB568C|nr:hypothetical protein [Kingella sp. (in: b-proteobacteria)]MDO4656989.1 hypothetical protein [Kingella sp. (in: b-proteobacteria)]